CLCRVPLEGAHETLGALRGAGLRTGVISNADGRVAALLEQAGLAASFDVVLDSHLEGVEKPHPEIFRRALARLEVAAAHAVFVGDIWSIDVEGSRAAGLRPILMDATGGYADRDCERIARLAELCERLALAPQGAKRPALWGDGRGEGT
ncbi:MAG TPA: HAD-IA family hydrolase, partial [Myxococcota bacterium]|nr:HAD-IA family hydrolase [Myxococcota bacterium]